MLFLVIEGLGFCLKKKDGSEPPLIPKKTWHNILYSELQHLQMY